MATHKDILSAYADTQDALKKGVARDLVEGFTTQAVNVEVEEQARLLQLLETLIEQYSANGYEYMARILKR